MAAGARACQLGVRGAIDPIPERREQTGSALNRAAVHYVEQRVEPAVVGVHVGAVAKAMRSRTCVAVGDGPADIRLTFEVFSSRVVQRR